jgi:tetratricopeptide (TPR) repeat protein
MTNATRERLAVAANHLKHRQLSAAAGVYRDILSEDPNHVEALNGLATEALLRGSSEVALSLLARAAAVDPTDATTYANLGQAHLLAGRLDEAGDCLDMALRLAPDHIEAAISRTVLLRKRDPGAAFEALKALALRHPQHAALQHNLAMAYLERQAPGPAAELLRKAVTLDPSLAEAWRSLGLVDAANGHLQSALDGLRRAHELAPSSLPTAVALGETLIRAGKAEETERLARRAAALSPLSDGPLVLQGRALVALGRLDDGVQALAKASKLSPKAPLPLLALAEALLARGDETEAIACAEEAAELASAADPVRMAAIALLLRRGRWEAGWRAMSRRLPEDVPIAGQSLTLAAPRSHADTLLFARFCPLVANMGGTVRLAGRTPLRELLADTPGLLFDEEAPAIGDLTWLGPLTGADPESAPPLRLSLRQERVAFWRKTFEGSAGPLIAVAWDAGGPLSLEGLLRSMPTGAQCVSLVTGPARAALPNASVYDAGARLGDYDDLAALLAVVDAVALPDGPAAHLAGALWTPGVIAVDRGHFALGAGEADSRWYPSLYATARFDSEHLRQRLELALNERDFRRNESFRQH